MKCTLINYMCIFVTWTTVIALVKDEKSLCRTDYYFAEKRCADLGKEESSIENDGCSIEFIDWDRFLSEARFTMGDQLRDGIRKTSRQIFTKQGCRSYETFIPLKTLKLSHKNGKKFRNIQWLLLKNGPKIEKRIRRYTEKRRWKWNDKDQDSVRNVALSNLQKLDTKTIEHVHLIKNYCSRRKWSSFTLDKHSTSSIYFLYASIIFFSP